MATDLQHTPLTDLHERAGAKLAAFAGWLMPVQFIGTIAEHNAVRSHVGVFDVSHLGTVWITGPAAADIVDRSFSNDPTPLTDGTSQYTLCLADDGGVLDDLIVYRLAVDRWLAVPNAANTGRVVGRLRSVARAVADEARDEYYETRRGGDPEAPEPAAGAVLVDDASTRWAMLAVQGPQAFATVQTALGIDLATLPWGGAVEAAAQGVERPVIMCRTGYTGETGGELLVAAEDAGAVWTALVDAGATPAGLGARDTLRLEMGYPLHGNDLSAAVTPWQARLGWAVKLDHADGVPRAFPGRDALAAYKAGGPSDRLLGLRSAGRRPLRAGCEVRRDGRVLGTTTSGGFSPTLGVGIALAFLDGVEPGDRATVDVRGSAVDVEVVRPPFVDRDPRS